MEAILQLLKFSEQPITTSILLEILNDYSRPFDKIDSLVKKGYLIQLKRGMYILGKPLNSSRPENMTISNHLYGPSYISLETALFFWGLTPEKVYSTTAMTTKRTTTFKTPVGQFDFLHLPTPYYSFGITSQAIQKNQTILISCPEKSIIDKIISTPNINIRSTKQAYQYLHEDLRIEIQSLQNLEIQKLMEWLPFCQKQNSIFNTIKLIQSL